MLAKVMAWVVKHPAICCIIILVLAIFGVQGQLRRLRTQRDKAKHKAQDANRQVRIEMAKGRAKEAKKAGDAEAQQRAEADHVREKEMKDEDKRHQKAVDEIEKGHERETNTVDFMRERARRGRS